MKIIMSIFTVVGMMLASNTAFSQCDTSMKYNDLVECIVVEGSGENYIEWKNKFETEYNNHQKSLEKAEQQSAEFNDDTNLAGFDEI